VTETSSRPERLPCGRLRIRVPAPLVAAALALLFWSALTLVGTLGGEPLDRALDEVDAQHGWSREEVHFLEASFRYRVLFSRLEARLFAGTPSAPRRAVVQMIFVPLAGWSVRSVAIHESSATRALAPRLAQG